MANHPDAIEVGTADETQLDRIERKLDLILTFQDEVRPLLAAGAELSDKLAQGGPGALMSLIMGR